MSITIYYPRIDLQLFGEGVGTGAEGTTGDIGAAAVSQGAKNPLANVKYGIQDAGNATPQVENPDAERGARFEALIKGEYKDLYDARVQDTIQKRLKGTKETVDKYNKLAPTIEMLSRKYGCDASDIEALTKAIEEDDTYYEDEALEKGVTVEQLKEIRKMERENAELKRQMDEQRRRENADRLYASWLDQSNSLKSIYPSFELNTEIANPKFADLLQKGIDVRTAYEVIHKDEIIPAAMQFTARTVEQKLTNSILANGARPVENGISHQSASLVKSDVSKLSKEDREEIIRRVQRGEKIRF